MPRLRACGCPRREPGDAGSGLVLTRPLRNSHPDGDPVTTPGTGITFSAPLRSGHAAGETVTSNGITFTPALRAAHAAGTPVNELGLKEPPLDAPMPAYWGFVLASLMTKPGAYLSEVTPKSQSTLRAYASYLDGTASVCLINTDDANPATVTVSGLGRQGTLKTYDYGLENPSIAEGTANASDAVAGLELRPESIKIIVADVGKGQPTISVHARS